MNLKMTFRKIKDILTFNLRKSKERNKKNITKQDKQNKGTREGHVGQGNLSWNVGANFKSFFLK